MNLTKFVFKSHKWLAVATGIITLIWFVSGVALTLPAPRQQPPQPGGQAAAVDVAAEPFRNLRVSIPEAVTAADRAAGQPVRLGGVSFRTIEGRLHYRLVTEPAGVVLVDGSDGSITKVTEEMARRIVTARSRVPVESLGTAALQTTHDNAYAYGVLPVYRFQPPGSSTWYYVETDGAEFRAVSRISRVKNFLTGMHTLDFLRPYMSGFAIQMTMFLFSIVGTVMTAFGFWILWIQWKLWLQSRRRG